MKCKHCKLRLGDTLFKSFCDRSCSTAYANTQKPKRERTTPKAKCQNKECKKIFHYSPSTRTGKYCSNACFQAATRQKNDKLILAGKAGHGTVKKYLIRTRGNRCEECGQKPFWNGKPLTLQMDHIDGDSDNNKPKNCRLICPNCHTQTSNYGSKGVGNRYRKNTVRNVRLRKLKGYQN